MAEVLTEKVAEIADITAVTMESTTETNVDGEAHLADGTLLEEMKKAVKQSTCFFFIAEKYVCPYSNFFFGLLSKKVEFYFADANLPYDKCTNLLVLTLLSVLNECVL